MKKQLKIDLVITVLILALGQLVFFLVSPKFLQVSYENRIYTTMGFENSQVPPSEMGDLRQAVGGQADAAQQFGQTLMGWLKFPNFMARLSEVVPLPIGSNISSHPQERQNMIITLNTPEEIKLETLMAVKDYLQAKIDEYNKVSQTNYLMTQLDFEQAKLQKTYSFGASVTLIITLILSGSVLFLRREIRA